jgi:hypothetical protein
MYLPNLVDWSKTMEILHDIQHVPGAQGCRITIIEVFQVLVGELLILQEQRLQRFLKIIDN